MKKEHKGTTVLYRVFVLRSAYHSRNFHYCTGRLGIYGQLKAKFRVFGRGR